MGAVKITKRDSFGYFNSSQVEVMFSGAVWWERLAKQFWKVAYRKVQTEIIYVTIDFQNCSLAIFDFKTMYELIKSFISESGAVLKQYSF